MYLLGSKKQWAHVRVDKASKETLNKVYDECKQQKLNEKRGGGLVYDKDVFSACFIS